MKLMAISLFLILIPSALALTFDFSSPSYANIQENFSVSILGSVSDDYDVKIFVQDNETKTILSEIFKDGWKNPYYYLKAAFPDKSDFIIQIKNISNNAVICTRLRKVSSKSYSELCKSIILLKSSTPSTKNTNDNQDHEDQSENTTTSLKKLSSSEDFVPLNASSSDKEPALKQLTEETLFNGDSTKVFLNSKQNSNEVYLTKDERLRIYSIYAFTAITIIILVFIVMKKL